MKKLKTAMIAAAFAVVGGAASAAVVQSYTFNSTSFAGVNGTLLVEDTATAGTYMFTLTNFSTTESMLTGFALDYSPNSSATTLTNDFAGEANTSDQDWFIKTQGVNGVSNSISFDFCAGASSNGQSCTGTGSGNDGLEDGGESSMFLIAFNPDVTFLNAQARFQAIGPNGDSDKIIGGSCPAGSFNCPNNTSPVPVPGGLPLMAGGLGLAAILVRRRTATA